MKILLVEDDERIAEFLSRGLKAEGYGIAVANEGSDGLARALSGQQDVIILDLMLPGMSGQEICQSLRQAGVATPIIMLTAMDSVEDTIEGLRLGADDYLTKPFAFAELLARIEALVRRSRPLGSKPRLLRAGDLTLDRDTLEVMRGGRAIQLTSKELALLELLMELQGKVVSRSRILQEVWGDSADPLTNIVDVYIRRLRAKIDDGAADSLIRTVRGRGYRLTAAG